MRIFPVTQLDEASPHADPGTDVVSGSASPPPARASRLSVRRASSEVRDARTAAIELVRELAQPDAALALFFYPPDLDAATFAKCLAELLPHPFMGCSTAGGLNALKGLTAHTIEGVSLSAEAFHAEVRLISDVGSLTPGQAEEICQGIFRTRGREVPLLGETLAFLLIDGLTGAEEAVTAELFAALRGVPLFGGSAGDDLRFERTSVMVNGEVRSGAAALCVIETQIPFRVFREQHITPTDTRLVITGADATRRIVTEINGMPAAQAYAKALGLDRSDLGPAVFSRHPVTVAIDGEHFVRSIQRLGPDDSLIFFCAIDEGVVLRLARGADLATRLEAKLHDLACELDGLDLVIACDCVLRRLEVQQLGQADTIAEILRPYPFVGFSTYGEQLDAVHVNQTMTGVAFGSRRRTP